MPSHRPRMAAQGSHQALGILQAVGQGLLHKHVEAGLQAGCGNRAVSKLRRADESRLQRHLPTLRAPAERIIGGLAARGGAGTVERCYTLGTEWSASAAAGPASSLKGINPNGWDSEWWNIADGSK